MCDYCDEQYLGFERTDFSGIDGIMYDKEESKYYLVIEHFKNEINSVEINYCPQCGKKLG